MKYVVQKTHYGIRFRHLFLTGYSQLFFQITPFRFFFIRSYSEFSSEYPYIKRKSKTQINKFVSNKNQFYLIPWDK
jgi:hypothetical protein